MLDSTQLLLLLGLEGAQVIEVVPVARGAGFVVGQGEWRKES